MANTSFYSKNQTPEEIKSAEHIITDAEKARDAAILAANAASEAATLTEQVSDQVTASLASGVLNFSNAFLSLTGGVLKGDQGIPGLQGPAGPAGSPGMTGLTGDVGPMGPAGAKGDQGIQGLQGLPGPIGPQGIQGLIGPAGAKGDQGIQGLQGLQGIQGLPGAQGDQGPIGLTPWKPTTAWQASTAYTATAPASVVTSGGNAYLCTTSHTSTSSIDLSKFTVIAAKGNTGNTGSQGIQGIQGVAGAKGDQGIQGVKGDTGATGPAPDTSTLAKLTGATFTGSVFSTTNLGVPRTDTVGGAYIQGGTAGNSGYLEFYPKGTATRQGYIGFADGTTINMAAEVGSFNFIGNAPKVAGNNIWHAGNFNPATKLDAAGGTIAGTLSFTPDATRQMVDLWAGQYGVGVQNNTTYIRTGTEFAVHTGGVHSTTQGDPGAGGTNLLRLRSDAFTYKGQNVYHSGNFNPATKADLTGAAFTGDLTTYRSATPSTGVVFLGNQGTNGGRYLYYDGTNYQMPGTQLFVNGNPAWTKSTLNVFTAKELGMNFNGGDDTAAFQAIPSKVPDGSTVIYPVGKTVLTAGLSYTDKSINWVGSGPATEIFFRANNAILFNVQLNDILLKFGLSNMSIYTNGLGNYGVNISRPSVESNIFYGPVISDVIFRGEDPNTQAFGTCIQFSNCYHFRVHRVHATGNVNYNMNFLWLIGHSTDGTVFDCRVALANTCIYATAGSFSEGMQVQFNKFVGVRHGVFLDSGNNSPGAQIVNNHINAFNFAIRCINRPQLQISGNLIYKYSFGDFAGIQIEAGCPASIIQGNTILGYRTSIGGTTSGIVVQGTSSFMVLDNIVQECAVGLDGTNTSSGLDDRNMFVSCVQGRQSFAAAGHVAASAYVR